MKINVRLNYNKILKSNWPSTVLISVMVGQCNRTVRVIAGEHVNVLFCFVFVFSFLFFFFSLLAKYPLNIFYFNFKKIS